MPEKIKTYNFNGTGSLTNPLNTAYGNNFTIELWMKPHSITQMDYSSFLMRGSGTTANGIHIYQGKIGFRSGESGLLGTALDDFNTLNYPVGEWAHIALIIKNSKSFEFYRNFQKISEGITFGNSTSTNSHISIGDWSANYKSFFNGSLALVRLWDVALPIDSIEKSSKQIINNNLNLIYELNTNMENTSLYGTVLFDTFEIDVATRSVMKNENADKYYSLAEKTLISLPSLSNKNMILHGIEQGKEIQLDAPFTKHNYVNESPIDNVNRKVFTQEIGKVNSLNIKEIKEDNFELIYTWYERNMTSNTTPAPLVASASSEYSIDYQAWKAFNGINDTKDCWSSLGIDRNGCYLTIDFGEKIKVNVLKIVGRDSVGSPSMSPKDFEIYVSDDGIVWSIVKSYSNQIGWTAYEERVYPIGILNNRFYRVKILSNNGSTATTSIGQLIFGYREVN
ncbi:LamG-like jellyroll fold domain-containing protein [Lysinibacillus louembei]|uniref:LamG-like jellyroll fold domain-containing protein n=1 Tax=Lysinibacillus louembei TaxID=1470088 RepID=A0ABZ0RX13_9BACI|nr:LamG-like jellyroll fold domain-containing protein [Lysinibacillus louembei]WPK11821.1 LamG-like jellyroll fold domain-containing protein [Lysinibacillus louembei]